MKETTRKRLSYALSTEQYRALEGMAYWNAELHFAVEKNDEENYLQRCRKNINFCFDDCDKRRIPFWVQMELSRKVELYKLTKFHLLLRCKKYLFLQ